MKPSPKLPSLLALIALLLAAPLLAQQKHPILLGTAWYPEQWPEARWEADLALMQQAGVHMVRVGEFAWSRMEPEEGHYDLDWLDRAIAAAARHDRSAPGLAHAEISRNPAHS
jgi:beta-galactosidase